MAYNLTRKNIAKFIENNDTKRILEIYAECTSIEDANKIKTFIEADGYELSHEQMVSLASSEIANKIRERDRDSLEKAFVPMKEKNTKNNDYYTDEEKKFNKISRREIRFFKSNYKDKVSSESYTILKQIYNTNKDKYYLGLYDIQYVVDHVLENGIIFGHKADFQRHIRVIHNFDLMMNQISSCNDQRQSYGSLIIKIPKEAIDNNSIPIYYNRNDTIYLNPKYIVCYVPVKNKKILTVEINNSMNDVESNIYNRESLENEKIKVDYGRTL